MKNDGSDEILIDVPGKHNASSTPNNLNDKPKNTISHNVKNVEKVTVQKDSTKILSKIYFKKSRKRVT